MYFQNQPQRRGRRSACQQGIDQSAAGVQRYSIRDTHRCGEGVDPTELGSRITKDGILQIVAQAERTQLGNKDAAIDLFYQLINKALTPPKPRKATRPTKSSVQRRLTAKKRDSDIKALRRNPGEQ
jgi:hypothetical protein